MQPTTATNQQLADRLLAEGRIPPDAHRRVVAAAVRNGVRVEDSLIDLGIMGEPDLLKYVATIHKTRFVSTEKLYKATVDPRLIALLSPKLADVHEVFPVLYAAETDTLSIVTSRPDDSDALKEVRLAAGVRVVQPLVARPATIRAAIRRAYHGDAGGFPALLAAAAKPPANAAASAFANRTTGSNPFPLDAIALAQDEAPTMFRTGGSNTGPGRQIGVEAPPPGGVVHFPRAHDTSEMVQAQQQAQALQVQAQQASQQAQALQARAQEALARQAQAQAQAQALQAQLQAQQQAQQAIAAQQAQQAQQAQALAQAQAKARAEAQAKAEAMAQAQARAMQEAQARAQAPPPKPAAPKQAAVELEVDPDDPQTNVRHATIQLKDHVAIVRALVGALDAQRDNLDGHSAQVADWVRRLCGRLEVPEEQATSYIQAALLHDLGKDGVHHVTLLNASRSDACRAEAETTLDVPRRFFGAVGLDAEIKGALRGMYERFDGQGIPMGRSGQAINRGARILSVCDSLVDLTMRRSNAAGRKLEPPAALSYLRMHAGSLFDPAVLDALRAEIGVDYPVVLADSPMVLLVDPDQATTSPLELQFLEHGFDVRTARDMQGAMNELQRRQSIAAVVSEVDLESPQAGMKLRERAANEPWGRSVALWILHTKRTEADVAEMAFELDVDDLIPKPGRPDAIAAKVKQLLDRKLQRARA